MPTEPDPKPPTDATADRLPDQAAAPRAIALAEYAALRAEITTLLALQGQFLSFSIVFFGFIVTLSSRVAGLPPSIRPLLPIPFGVLGLAYADVAFRIMRAARYLHIELRPRLDRLGGDGCLGWETYIRARHPGRGVMHWMDRLRWIFFLGPAIAFAAYGVPRALPITAAPWSWTAWIISVCLIVLNILAISRMGRFSKRVTEA
jgi:hypothetical protein